nr:MAG TPA: hypothetical protein [Caudoviricetes sp.]
MPLIFHVPLQLYLSTSVTPSLASFYPFQVESSYFQFHVSFPFHVSCY